MMSKIKQSPKKPAAERCQQLLTAAEELFVRKGYRDTTTDEIARRAGLTKGALYYHFRSKEDILFALVRHVTDEHFCRLKEGLERSGTPAQAVSQLAEPGDPKHHRDLHDNFDFWIQAMRVPRIKRFINQRFRQFVDKFVAAVGPGYGSKTELRHLAVFSFALIHGLRIRRVLDPETVNFSAQMKLFDSLLKSRYGKVKSAKGKK